MSYFVLGFLTVIVIVIAAVVLIVMVIASSSKSRRQQFPQGNLYPVMTVSTPPPIPARPAPEKFPFKRNKYFLSTTEQSFYRCLKQAAMGCGDLFAKVRLLDALWLPPQSGGKQSWNNRVQSKHIDFLLCDHNTLVPILAIELDDSSHQRLDRQERDEFVDKVLDDAGLPLLRVQARAAYDIRMLADEIRRRLAGQSQAGIN